MLYVVDSYAVFFSLLVARRWFSPQTQLSHRQLALTLHDVAQLVVDLS